MAVPVIEFSEHGRRKSTKFLGILHWTCIIPSLICLFTALYIQIVIQDKILFIENYNGAVLPGFLVFTGFFSFISHILCGKAFWENRKIEKRANWINFLYPALAVTLLIFLLELTSGILCFVHISELEESLDNGIKSAMESYRNDATTKEEVDILQMDYECCGSRSYLDWFDVNWIHQDYKSTSQNSGRRIDLQEGYSNDNVPFSCCNAAVLRPCIRHNVYDNGRHYNYDYRQKTTLHAIGCTDKLMQYYEDSLLVNIGALMIGLSFVQLILCIVSRLVQTAISGSLRTGSDEGPSVGYIFNCGGGQHKGLNDTMTTEMTEGEPLLDTTFDTTFDTTLDDSTRYVSMDGEDGPIYENVPAGHVNCQPGDEGPVYHDPKVERYLSDRFNTSKDYFEKVSTTKLVGTPSGAYEHIEMSNVPTKYRRQSTMGGRVHSKIGWEDGFPTNKIVTERTHHDASRDQIHTGPRATSSRRESIFPEAPGTWAESPRQLYADIGSNHGFQPNYNVSADATGSRRRNSGSGTPLYIPHTGSGSHVSTKFGIGSGTGKPSGESTTDTRVPVPPHISHSRSASKDSVIHEAARIGSYMSTRRISPSIQNKMAQINMHTNMNPPDMQESTNDLPDWPPSFVEENSGGNAIVIDMLPDLGKSTPSMSKNHGEPSETLKLYSHISRSTNSPSCSRRSVSADPACGPRYSSSPSIRCRSATTGRLLISPDKWYDTAANRGGQLISPDKRYGTAVNRGGQLTSPDKHYGTAANKGSQLSTADIGRSLTKSTTTRRPRMEQTQPNRHSDIILSGRR